jgi:hypothetical protein
MSTGTLFKGARQSFAELALEAEMHRMGANAKYRRPPCISKIWMPAGIKWLKT